MTIEVSELIYPKGTKILLVSVPIGNMPLIKAKSRWPIGTRTGC